MPLSLSVLEKFAGLLQNQAALPARIQAAAQADGLAIPLITVPQVVISSVSPELADNNLELTYPRVCLYVSTVKNSLMERFRTFSGTVLAVAEIWASATLATQCDQWIHYYLDAVTSIAEENRGDWGDGVYFSGIYEAQMQAPKAGGLGFVQSVKVTCTINVSVD